MAAPMMPVKAGMEEAMESSCRASRELALPAEAAAVRPFRVGTWEVHPALNRISCREQAEQIEPRIMHVLVCLAAAPGTVISRKSLLETAWRGVIVGEEVLTRAISQLRSVLQDRPRSPQYIETIRGGGYRLVAPVMPLDTPAMTVKPVAPYEPWQQPSAGPHLAPSRWIYRLSLAALMVLSLAAALWLSHTNAVGITAPKLPSEIPFTTCPNEEIHAAFSPCGNLVAYSANTRAACSYDIFVKPRGSDNATRLTESPGEDIFPTWSPDGSTIAFARVRECEAGIYVVPAAGGPVSKLCTADHSVTGLDWSPDGRHLVYSANKDERGAQRLYQLDTRSLEIAHLTEPPTLLNLPPLIASGDTFPAYSPDGSRIAFVRTDAVGLSDIFIVARAGGEVQRLTEGLNRLAGLAWTPQGKHLIASALSGDKYLLWRVSVADGTRTWLQTLQAEALYPAIDPAGKSLIYTHRFTNQDIWRYRLFAGAEGSELGEPLITSTKNNSWPVLSPDGSQIAFVSNRSGRSQIWISDAEGARLRQLTRFSHGLCLQRPRWSPDSQQIAFSAVTDGRLSIHVVAVATGNVHRIPPTSHNEQFEEWSGDGGWLYYDAGQGTEWVLWRVRPDGSDNTRVVLPEHGLEDIRIHDDFLYYSRTDSGGIWRWPLAGDSEPQLVVDPEIESTWHSWAVTCGGIYYLFYCGEPPEHKARLGHFDLTTGTSRPTDLYYPAGTHRLVFSRDGSIALAARADCRGADLILIEDAS